VAGPVKANMPEQPRPSSNSNRMGARESSAPRVHTSAAPRLPGLGGSVGRANTLSVSFLLEVTTRPRMGHSASP
jgi:hypothetical protein